MIEIIFNHSIVTDIPMFVFEIDITSTCGHIHHCWISNPSYSLFWVDYGGTDHVPDYAILLVKEPFRHLPVQAIPSSLALGSMLPGELLTWIFESCKSNSLPANQRSSCTSDGGFRREKKSRKRCSLFTKLLSLVIATFFIC